MNTLRAVDFHPLKFLILDDSVFDRARLRRMINVARIRCQIIEAICLADLGDALIHDIDLAILDYDLPDGTGLDALRRINDMNCDAGIASIIVTGNQSPKISKAASNRGCSSCLSKVGLQPDTLKLAIFDSLRRTRGNLPINKTGTFQPSLEVVAS